MWGIWTYDVSNLPVRQSPLEEQRGAWGSPVISSLRSLTFLQPAPCQKRHPEWRKNLRKGLKSQAQSLISFVLTSESVRGQICSRLRETSPLQRKPQKNNKDKSNLCNWSPALLRPNLLISLYVAIMQPFSQKCNAKSEKGTLSLCSPSVCSKFSVAGPSFAWITAALKEI